MLWLMRYNAMVDEVQCCGCVDVLREASIVEKYSSAANRFRRILVISSTSLPFTLVANEIEIPH